MIVRSTNSQKCLRNTTTSRSISAPSAVQLAAATERVGPPPIRRALALGLEGVGAEAGVCVVVAISRVVPSRSG
jgi:hypothetical protein